MAIRTRTTTLCDWHLDEGEEVDSTKTVTIQVDKRKPRVLDLCDECRAEIDNILRLGRKSA